MGLQMFTFEFFFIRIKLVACICSVEGDSNALIMPAKKSNKRKGMNQVCSAGEISLLFCYALSFKRLNA